MYNGIRFNNPDPLAGNRPWESPYAFCGNNPVNRIDPDGRDWYSYSDDKDKLQYQYTTEYRSQSDLDRSGIKGRYLGSTYSTGDSYYSLNGTTFDMKNNKQNGLDAIENDINTIMLNSMKANPGSSTAGDMPLNAGRVIRFAGQGVASGTGKGLDDALAGLKGLQGESNALGWGLDYGTEIAKVTKAAKWCKAIGVIGSFASAFSTEYQFNAGQITPFQRKADHVVTTLSIIPIIGTPLSIGWEAGKLYGPSKW